jgi:hypothetical protein
MKAQQTINLRETKGLEIGQAKESQIKQVDPEIYLT